MGNRQNRRGRHRRHKLATAIAKAIAPMLRWHEQQLHRLHDEKRQATHQGKVQMWETIDRLLGASEHVTMFKRQLPERAVLQYQFTARGFDSVDFSMRLEVDEDDLRRDSAIVLPVRVQEFCDRLRHKLNVERGRTRR